MSEERMEQQERFDEVPQVEGVSPAAMESVLTEAGLYEASAQGEKPETGQAGSGEDPSVKPSDDKPADGDGTPAKPEDSGESKSVPLTALQEERAKRQAKEKELKDAYDRELAAAKTIMELRRQQGNPQGQPQGNPPGDGDDPIRSEVRQALDQELGPYRKDLQQNQEQQRSQELAQHLDIFERRAKVAHPDYDQVTGPIWKWAQTLMPRAMTGDLQAAQALRTFGQTVLNSPDPAEMAYTLGIRFLHQQNAQGNAPAATPAPAGNPAPVQNPQPGTAMAAPAPAAQAARDQATVEAMANHPRGADISGGGSPGQNTEIEAIISSGDITTEQWRKLPPDVRQKILRGQVY